MGCSVSMIARALKSECVRHLPQNPLFSHFQEILAAALGHESFSAYMTWEGEDFDFRGARHIVLDLRRLCDQLFKLGYTSLAVQESIVAAIQSALSKSVPHLCVHQSIEGLRSFLERDVIHAIETSSVFARKKALLQVTGSNLELAWQVALPLDTPGAHWSSNVAAVARISRAAATGVIEISAAVEFDKLGTRVLGAPRIHTVEEPGDFWVISDILGIGAETRAANTAVN